MDPDTDDDDDGLDDVYEEDEVCYFCGLSFDRCECDS
jgi:hypothetical protein